MRRLLQSESGCKNLSAERRWIIGDHEKTLPKVLHYPQLFLRQSVNLLYMEVQDATFRYFNIPFSWSVSPSSTRVSSSPDFIFLAPRPLAPP